MAAKKKDSKAKQILMSVLRYLVASISAAIAFYVLFALIFSTEEEKRLQKENRLYNNLFDGMKAKEELIGDVVEGLLEKDDAIYEELFSTAPPSMDELGTHRAAAITDNVSLPEKYYVRSASAQSDSLMRIASSVDANFSEIFRLLQDKADSIPPLSLPLKNMSYVQIGASVGMKQSPMYDLQVHHDGLDIIAPQGTKVYAAAPGRVSRVVRGGSGTGHRGYIHPGFGPSPAFRSALQRGTAGPYRLFLRLPLPGGVLPHALHGRQDAPVHGLAPPFSPFSLFPFPPASPRVVPALNSILARIVVKIRVAPALNSILACIVVKIRVTPALNSVLARIVAKIRVTPALNSVLARIVAKIRVAPALNSILARIVAKRRRDGRTSTRYGPFRA